MRWSTSAAAPCWCPNDPLYAAGPASGRGPDVGQWYLRAPAGDGARPRSMPRRPGTHHRQRGRRGRRARHRRAAPTTWTCRGQAAARLRHGVRPGDRQRRQRPRRRCRPTRATGSPAPRTARAAATFDDCGDGQQFLARHPDRRDRRRRRPTTAAAWPARPSACSILPVRVLGKCGGFDSDIQAGMRWAAASRCRACRSTRTRRSVINLSLGGSGACSAVPATRR